MKSTHEQQKFNGTTVGATNPLPHLKQIIAGTKGPGEGQIQVLQANILVWECISPTVCYIHQPCQHHCCSTTSLHTHLPRCLVPYCRHKQVLCFYVMNCLFKYHISLPLTIYPCHVAMFAYPFSCEMCRSCKKERTACQSVQWKVDTSDNNCSDNAAC